MLIKRYFGLKSSIFCDRCHENISTDFYVLCKTCFLNNPTKIRLHEVSLPYDIKSEGLTCALCNTKKNQIHLNHVCRKCLSQHDDNTHFEWDINPEHTRDTILYRSCICGDVLKITIGEDKVFEYFKVGRKNATFDPYKCNRILNRNVEECIHDWIILGSNIKDPNVAKNDFLTMRENPGLQAMGLDDIGLLENIAFGSTTFWCCKCGCFYDLSPRKKCLLPEQGYIT